VIESEDDRMKSFSKKIFCVLLICILFASCMLTMAAEPNAVYDERSKNVVIEGVVDTGFAGDIVSVKATDKGSIAHVGIAECGDGGKYTYKFKYTGNPNDLSLSVTQGEKGYTPDIKVNSADTRLYNVELTLKNGSGRNFKLGVDTDCFLHARIDNIYGGKDKYTLIVAFYDDNGNLLSAKPYECEMEYAKDGSLQSNEIYLEAIPQTTNSIKGFAFKSLTGIEPLGKSTVVGEKQSFGLNNLNDEPGELKIAFLGGSITEGAGYGTDVPEGETATRETSRYSSRVVNEYFKAKYPNKTVTEINAGIGGSASNSGLMRIKRDVMDYEPDVVFVEFAVNDAGNADRLADRASTFEDVLRNLINMPKQPVIILLYSAHDRPSEYYSSASGRIWANIAKHEEQQLAEHYGIGSIDFDGYIEGLFDSGEMTDFAQYFFDNLHPNYEGHKLYAQYINDCLTQHHDEYFKKISAETERLFSPSGFENAKMIHFSDAAIEYGGNWIEDGEYLRAPSEGGTITYTFKGTSFGMIGPYSNGRKAGATYSIDNGKYVGDIGIVKDGETSETFIRETNFLRITGLEDCEHTITITANGSSKANELLRLTNLIVAQ